MKVYRGSAGAARTYVEADRSRVDDYYLAEGTGLADRYVATSAAGEAARRGGPTCPANGVGGRGVAAGGTLDGDAYESWVGGFDVHTGVAKGRLRTDDQAVRFVEVVVNGPKTWSLAASVHPEVSAAYDAAQDRAAVEIMGWLAEHTTTRVGPRGRQVQVPVERLEAAVIRHHTSRAGDPHRHLHLQINARVWARGSWRGVHTVGVRDSLDAINGIGHAAIMCDPEFRSVLARHGYTLNTESGEIEQLAPFAGAFSARAAQIGRNVDRYEAEWRTEHPGTEPGPKLRRAWDARAWADARPDKVVPRDGTELRQRWLEELHDLGFGSPATPDTPNNPAAPGPEVGVAGPQIGQLNRDLVVEVAMIRLGARRSGWNAADVRGEVERLIALIGIVAETPTRTELAEDLTARVLRECVPLLDHPDVPEHIRSLTSSQVLSVERELIARLTSRADTLAPTPSSGPATAAAALTRAAADGLDVTQQHAAAQLAGGTGLLLVEGAAGAGKTCTLAAARDALSGTQARMVVVSPTLKAASVAGRELGTDAYSAAWLVFQHGFRWDQDGNWTRVKAQPDDGAQLRPGDLLVVDEAGMLDQDTALALLTVADEAGARVALVGDRHQLPAVGRGGVLDLAADAAPEHACLTLETVHRFADPDYADLSLRMRTGEQPAAVFDALLARGDIVIHPSDTERLHHLTLTAASGQPDDRAKGVDPEGGTEGGRTLIVADTREQVAGLNAAIRDHRLAQADGGRPGDSDAVTTKAGERIGVGDTITTRRNDRTLGVVNRATWAVTGIGNDGSLHVAPEPSGDRGTEERTAGRAQGGTQGGTQPGTQPEMQGSARVRRGERTLPAAYVEQHVELAYARTVYGAQGETVDRAHFALGEQTGAASAYVAMTRGRDANTAHLVADNVEQARDQWVAVFNRDRADLGPTQAAQRAGEDLERYGSLDPHATPDLDDHGCDSADWENAEALAITAAAAARGQHLEDRAPARKPEPGRRGPGR